MSEQPRTESGKFTVAKVKESRNRNESDTVGVLDDEHISDSVEYVKVTREYLQEALDRIEDDEVVDLAVVMEKRAPWGSLLVREPVGDVDESIVVVGRAHPEDLDE